MVVSLCHYTYEYNLTTFSHEFLQRTEDCFRALHERVSYLEECHAWRGPSDEQVERVLRKILAERFTSEGQRRTDSIGLVKSNDVFTEDARARSSIKPITIDAASLFVEPESVPSRAYAETFQMLEGRLTDYPHIHRKESTGADVQAGKVKVEYESMVL